MKTKYSVRFQICIGIICGIMNVILSKIFLSITPLYMDTLFTVAASLFGGLSGLIAATTFHVLVIIISFQSMSGIAFIICSYSTVALVYLYTKNKDSIQPIDIVILSLLLTLIISFEGGLIFIIIYNLFNYQEDTYAKYMTYMLMRQNISLVLSSFLARIPINLIDKVIAVIFGYGFTKLIQKIPTIKNHII